LVCEFKKKTIKEEVNFALRKAFQSKRLKEILGVEDVFLVSSDCKRIRKNRSAGNILKKL
jgi:glyceraldehyde-3-phosphate dehydrogenase/erythrose-4-phosphate dehydrogenase